MAFVFNVATRSFWPSVGIANCPAAGTVRNSSVTGPHAAFVTLADNPVTTFYPATPFTVIVRFVTEVHWLLAFPLVLQV